MESVRLSWLGHPLVELKGRAIKLETRKAAALLAYLSLNPGECPREVLATMLWQDGNQQKALANLRRTLSSLNSRLPGWIEADRETIAMKHNSKLWVDVEAFHHSLAQFKEHNHRENEVCEDCLSVLDETVELYRSDFLDGLNLSDSPTFDDWQFFQRNGLRQEFADVLQRLSSGRSELGQWDQAILCARRWVALDRLNESACRALMEVYARSGQRTAALHQYEELARLLNEQMVQEPEEETRRLYEQIRGRDEAKQVTESPERPTSFPLLKTKLYLPTPPSSRVERSHLTARLSEVEKKVLTVVSAPAGFGKTTLLAEWIAQTSLPVAWLSLDNGDNDPYRFLSYLIAGLESIHEGIGGEARQIMQSSQVVPPHIILVSLMNDLGKVAEPYALVLDDYQFIIEHAVHETMAYLLDHIPSNMHLIVSTRADPPLQLGRLHANDQVLELRTQDLRFGPEEVTAFLNDVMRLGLPPEDIETLETRTEGWVVGLKMAALSLKGHENAREFIRAFSGSHRYVLDYLVEEVLKRQPSHIQTFLLETSILEKVNGALCDALMTEEWRQSGDSTQAVLEHLERNNLFLIPLDDNKQWFRYHHLFADLLHSRLQQVSAARVNVLHRQASQWFEGQGMFNEAVEHALFSKDYHQSAKLLDTSSQTRVLINAPTLQKWIQQIPDEILRQHPWIQVSQAWIWLSMGKLERIEELLELAESCIRADNALSVSNLEREDIRSHVAMLRAYLAFFRGDPLVTIEQATLALQNVRPSNSFLRSRIALQLGESYSVIGELEQAKRYLHEAIVLSTKENDYSVATVAYFRLGTALKIQGRLVEAENLYRQNLLALKEMGGQDSAMLGRPEIGLGDILRERGQLDAARVLLSIGHKHSELQAQPYDLVHSYICLALLFQAEGRIERAMELLTQAESLFHSYTNPPVVRVSFECYQVSLWLKLGMLSQAEQWVAENQLDCHTLVTYATEPKLISLARVLIAHGRLLEAQDLLGRLASVAETGGRNGRLMEILALEALSAQASGRTALALDILARGLTLAESEGYMRIFLDEGEPMIKLLKRLRTSKSAHQLRDYIDRLLEAATPN